MSSTSTIHSASGNSLDLFVRGLTVLDYAFWRSGKGVLGGSLHVDADMIGERDDEGVIFDFSHA
ncbi:MAG: hypothetical protein HQL31_03200, partial [Planctomycetes bacterium]|nr:hypothetical protein [Planctomycetota bacterium]